MAKFKNNTVGARGILLQSGAHLLVEAGNEVEIDDSDVVNAHPDLETDWTAPDAKPVVGAKPRLTGKTKDELLQIAADEGVTIEDGATNNDIVATIELHRETAAS
jgi:hypothetical protein